MMQLEHSLRISKSLADSSRLRILNALLAGERCAEELSTILGLAPSTVSFHLKKLVAAGLLSSRKEQYYAIYSVRPEILSLRLGDLASFDDPAEQQQEIRREGERHRVFQAFFDGGRLARMPSQNRKRLVVLEAFASLFDPGGRYPEQEVNDRVGRLFADYCLVRRLLVDEGFMTRNGGTYTRTEKESRPAPAEVAVSSRGADERKAAVKSHEKQLKRDYLLNGRRAGVFRIRNKQTGRSLLGASLDVRAALNRTEFELKRGSSRYSDLLADYGTLGNEGFTWEIVETVEEGTDPAEVELELELMEEQHLAALDRQNTYNLPGSARIPPRRKHRAAPSNP